ncbi:MAG: SoxR reducing system RseC family protein [Deltaproteobacteria bacterium]|nr:SoxR reducing system RseC family protein [Deltaproteobacteria bacterium]MBW2040966.1 SoxR reducing system RseC family protein [Deltaproteobacteria bacterium]MBW2130937.1 SoxR reducing system RseC family protein [Deltaproteobacteria bacterium]
MMKKIGLVVKTFDDRTAEIMADKQSACGGCQDTRKCKSCLSGSDKVVSLVQNLASAAPGDVVEIQHTQAALWESAALFYGVPVLGLLAGAFIGGSAANGWGMDESAGAAAAGIAGLILGLLVVVFSSKTAFGRRRWIPRIVRVIEDGGKQGDRDITSADHASNPSCCSG